MEKFGNFEQTDNNHHERPRIIIRKSAEKPTSRLMIKKIVPPDEKMSIRMLIPKVQEPQKVEEGVRIDKVFREEDKIDSEYKKLFDEINGLGEIVGSHSVYPADIIITLIEKVREDNKAGEGEIVGLDTITSANNLRVRVKELIERERKNLSADKSVYL